MKKCPKCGAKLPDSAKYCASCGEKVESTTHSLADEEIQEKEFTSEEKESAKNFKFKKDDKKKPGSNKWNKLSLDLKLSVFTIVLSLILGVVAFVLGRTGAGSVSIIQIIFAVISLLIAVQVIKVSQGWVKKSILIIVIALFIPFLILFVTGEDNLPRYDWNDVVLKEVIPEPESNKGEIKSNSDSLLSLDVYKIEDAGFKEYVDSCKEKGFTVDPSELDWSFDAYNSEGYYLSLYLDDEEKIMELTLDASEKFGNLSWPNSTIASLLPVPKSARGVLILNDEHELRLKVSETSEKEFEAYVEECIEKGFDVEGQKSGTEYLAENNDGYQLSIEYLGGDIMSITVKEPEYTISIKVSCDQNLMFSQYDVDLYVDDILCGTVLHGETETFEAALTKGIYEIKFVNAEDEEVTGSVEIKIHQDESLEYNIHCTSFGIDIETIHGPHLAPEDDEVTMIKSSYSYADANYEDVQNELLELGFTNVIAEILYDVAPDDTDEIGKVESVSIDGEEYFSEGDIFKRDAQVIITYHMSKDDPNNPDKESEPEPPAENLTASNCPELASILSLKDPGDPSVSTFANKYYGQIIEFDGCVNYLANHGDYTTRWDVLLGAGDYNPNSASGPNFQLSDVSFYDMNVSGGDSISIGTNVHVVAQIGNYDANTQLFELNVLSMRIR